MIVNKYLQMPVYKRINFKIIIVIAEGIKDGFGYL
jgi:hypothetical protein